MLILVEKWYEMVKKEMNCRCSSRFERKPFFLYNQVMPLPLGDCGREVYLHGVWDHSHPPRHSDHGTWFDLRECAW